MPSCGGKAGALPAWFRRPVPDQAAMAGMRGMISSAGLNTVCQSAHCPNTGECWSKGTATFMILGDRCSRSCRFCAVTSGKPREVSDDEPLQVAEAVRSLGLKYAVITSVTRDDLPDGGAVQFVRTVRAVQMAAPQCAVELLIPDFNGDEFALSMVADAKPQVIGHNLETVRRLSPQVRSGADHDRSLRVLGYLASLRRGIKVKSGLMVGLGETDQEVLDALGELYGAGCDIVTIGQYLSPSKDGRHLPVARFVDPDRFCFFREAGLKMGFEHVASGALVRSSYLAEEGYKGCSKTREGCCQP